MHNPTRTLVVLLALSIGGVAALGYIAQRYAGVLEQSVDAPDVQWQVDVFVAIRREMHRAVQSWDGNGAGQPDLAGARDRALRRHRLGRASYALVRRQYRAWREGRLRAGSAIASAFERRRQDLRRVELGPYESLDS